MYNPLPNTYSWWETDKKELHKEVFQFVRQLDRQQEYRSADNVKYMRLYGNFDVLGLKSYNFLRSESSYAVQNRVTLNIVQSMTDTVVSKITKNKPKPMFITDGGDWSLQRKAKKLNKFVEGQMLNAGFYDIATKCFLDSCIFGTGVAKIFREGSEIKIERVFPNEIKVPDHEGVYGKPRQMHQTKFIHRDVLKSAFPDNEFEISQLGKAADGYTMSVSEGSVEGDMVLVIESWRLPTSKDSKDGLHCITIDNATLFSEPWEREEFPFVFWRWSPRPIGFFGQGVSEQLQGIQLEINKILRTIQVSMHLVSIPKIFVEASSKIVTAHLNNKIGGIVRYAGTPPTPGQLGTIPPELFSHLDRLYAKAYEVIGISQLSATASKPAGLNSGKALRVYNDIETERFMTVGRSYEQAFLDAAKQLITLAKEVDALDGEYKVKVKDKKFMKTIKWKEVDLEEDQYMMHLFPISALSSTPAARLQDVQDLLQSGFISREDGMKLLDFPDLEGYYNMTNAGVEDIERQIELMMENGEYETPEPYQNLQLGIVKMQQAYLLYRSQGAPENNLELLRRWIEDADGLVKNAKQEELNQAAAAQAAQSGPPMGRPEPLPQSDMMPPGGVPSEAEAPGAIPTAQ